MPSAEQNQPVPQIPLSDAARAAYQDLYHKVQTAIESTNDATALVTLGDSRTQIDDVLTKDNIFRFHANTIKFSEVYDQVKLTNNALATLKQQIAAVKDHIASAAQIIAAIDKVLTVLPIL